MSMRESVETRMTHHYCKHMGTRPIHPAGCPGFLLYPHHCLRPEGTWAGSHNFSLGCPGCPSCLTSESRGSGGWRWVTENFPRPTHGWVINQHPFVTALAKPKQRRCLLSHELVKWGSNSSNSLQNCMKIAYFQTRNGDSNGVLEQCLPLQLPKMWFWTAKHPYCER